MKNNGKNFLFSLISILYILKIEFTYCEEDENYITSSLDGEEGNYLLDVKDYHNLNIIVSTSKKIYLGIPPTYKSTTNAKLNNCSSVATINENYILVSCLEDSLLGKINIISGIYTPLLSYLDFSISSLSVPSTICSLTIFNKKVFIGYTKIINNNKTNIIFKVNINNEDTSDGPIIDSSISKKFYVFPNSYYKTNSIRQIDCEVVNNTDDLSMYRLVCAYDNYDLDEKDNNKTIYNIYAFSIKTDLSGIDNHDKDNRVYGFTSGSGFRLYKIDALNIRCVMRKMVKDIFILNYLDGIIVRTNILDSNLTTFTAKQDLFDYNNNFVFSSGNKFLNQKLITNYFTINKPTSKHYYKIYDYTTNDIVKLFGYYDKTKDYIMVVSQYSSFIKYFILKNNNNICEFNSYSGILKIQTNDIIVYNIEDFLDYYSDFDKIIFKEIIIYELLKDQNYSNYAFILKETDLSNIFYFSNEDIFIRTCSNKDIKCTKNFLKCDNCNIYSSENDKCFIANQRLEGYLYDSYLDSFKKCYETCQFCKKNKDESSSENHNCESCIDGYIPSYKFLGNCYKNVENGNDLSINVDIVTDISFSSIYSCPIYKINSTGECVNECPNYEYSSFIYQYLNFSNFTNNSLTIENYKKIIISPPKYLYNKVCYESCPLFLKTDEINNKCTCKHAFHIDNEITTCYEEDFCINNSYKYFLDDTKQCVSGKGCPSGYYQFNFQCYKNGCPSEAKEYPENSYKCISIYEFCYINEHFQNICMNEKIESYNYKFDDTIQYLKSCEESLIYTTLETKTFLYNKTCYLNCPENTIKNNITNKCECLFFGLYSSNDNYICYSEEEICPEKVPIVDLNICLNNIEECRKNNYKIFNNECYFKECPVNSRLDDNDKNKCICSNYFYNDTINNILNCFEDSITCENKNYLYKNPDISECYISLDECFSKGNSYYFNRECYNDKCPNGKIALSSTNEIIQKFFIEELSLTDKLKNKICICDITKDNINWNISDFNDIICLENCGEDYEPESLTHKCVEKCNPIRHFTFNNQCYKDGCPNGTKLNISDEENGKKTCICEGLFFINDTNNFMVCCNDENKELCLNYFQTTEPQTTEPQNTEPSTTEPPTTEPPTTEPSITEPHTTEPPTTKPSITEPPTNEPPTTVSSTTIPSTNETPTIEPFIKDSLSTELITTNSHSNELFIEESQISKTSSVNITESLTEIILNQNTSSLPSISDISTNQNVSEQINSKIIKSDEMNFNSMIIETNNPKIISNESSITESITKKENNKFEIFYPEEYYKDPNNCAAVYNNECYPHCPDGTCLTTNDVNLVNCIPIESNVVVFNDICFVNFDEIINNLKNISQTNHTISVSPGITINVYSSKSGDQYSSKHSNLSIIYLNECEDLLLDYYNLTNDTILYIIGIDSPNKNKSYVINVYNYGVFLENGFQLDHLNVCKDKKIIINSPIKDTDSIKIEDGMYFSSLGYDIYDIGNEFYNEQCSPASINGNDITLSDRKKDFYPSEYNLCNKSCEYESIDYDNERFICECDLNYNFSNNNGSNNEQETEENVTYWDYLLSLMNYKIIPCYKLLFNSKNYHNNIGFYISGITIVISIVEMIIFFIFGIKKLKQVILNGVPNKKKLQNLIKNQKNIEPKIKKNKNDINNKIKKDTKNINYFNFIYINQKNKKNPPKKKEKKNDIKINDKHNRKKEKQKDKDNIKKRNKYNEKFETKNETEKIYKKNKSNKKNNKDNNNINKSLIINLNKNKGIKINKKKNVNLFNLNQSSNNNLFLNKEKFKINKNLNKILELSMMGRDASIDKKEINHIPYTQALRIDQRDYLEMFGSILANEIKIISIFYYRNKYVHLSLSTSIYLFELLLDLTINCFLCTDNYISQKYKNGKLKFITSILLSLMSNIFAYIITYYVIGLVEYSELLEMILKNVLKKKHYFLNVIKFKKYLIIKLIIFYALQNIFNLMMCYYLTIFCTIYHQTQESIMTNYIFGIVESLLFSLLLSLFTAFLRYVSLKVKHKQLYNTSKYLYEKF